MAILQNWWNHIVEWFQDSQDRLKLLRSFNQSARSAFINGCSPVLMEASISKGDSSYRHSFSKWMSSGFRIKVLSGRQLSRDEIRAVGNTILGDDMLVRRMVALGWDTLEIHSDIGKFGCKWQLREFLQLGQ